MSTNLICNSMLAQRLPRRLRGAILTMETAFYIIFIIIIASIAISTLMDTSSAKRATTTQEVEQIRTAAVQYKSFYKGTPTFSEGFTELFTTMAAGKSVDGMVHGPFLQPDKKDGSGRWTKTGGATDLWGNKYKYDSTKNEIYSTCGSSDTNQYVRVYIGQ